MRTREEIEKAIRDFPTLSSTVLVELLLDIRDQNQKLLDKK